MRLAKRLLIGGAVLLATTAARAQNDPAGQVKDVAGGKPTIELVFVIDTTGSMGGLIDGAKQKIWGIVNEVMKSPAKPEVRMGLVAYRDHEDAYVTQVLPVTRDLDKVYSTLMAYKADGGGDTPEDVRQALADGVHKAGWSPRSSNIAQILFLVGDAPPHDDYGNEPDTITTASAAVKAGIIVNTIQCGDLPGTGDVWRRICRAGEGQYFAIAQDGGVVAIATPFDAELSQLGTKVGETYMAYGGGMGMLSGLAFRSNKAAAHRKLEGNVALAAPATARAERAFNKAINAAAYDDSDLIQGVENGTVKLDALKQDELPDELQKLSADERKKVIAGKIEERKKIREQILELAKKRDAFILEERQKQSAKNPTGFDQAVSEALKVQIARKGLKL
ncbi:Mg-chelatase subunit ChlD [Singulisphaera sp. GP187]|uniref:vWA domain-containing protein n=1 Tax=Singulisphaera sp. GP187 TaxID=1882752 RepID=UPI00092C76DD|nr:vWA domain-containing protein [Singulisphaera sp. GP187]SIO56745.1 Mg-chelatase subunit ChlD [Singulisphaera sp. GP187]